MKGVLVGYCGEVLLPVMGLHSAQRAGTSTAHISLNFKHRLGRTLLEDSGEQPAQNTIEVTLLIFSPAAPRYSPMPLDATLHSRLGNSCS